MGFISRLILGESYEDGYDCAKSWNKQGGSYPASGDTIDGIYQSTEGSTTPEDFYEGWRDYEDNQRGFFGWLLGRKER